ncbi:MAG: hypothetical protein ACREFZ_05025 [Acetobacteraceae bacterium]
MFEAGATYEAMCRAFAWTIPTQYNIGVDACDKWADGSGRLALSMEKRRETRSARRSMS